MSAPHRDLHAVPVLPQEGAPRSRESSPWWAWIAVVGFVLCAAGWYASQQGAAELQAQLEETQAELAGAHAELRAHQSHLDLVRNRSDALAGDLQALTLEAQRLAEDISRDPGAPVPPARPIQPTGAEGDGDSPPAD